MATGSVDKKTATLDGVEPPIIGAMPVPVLVKRLKSAEVSLARVDEELQYFDPQHIPDILLSRYNYLTARQRQFSVTVAQLKALLKG